MLTLKLQTAPVSGVTYLENNSFRPPASLQHPHKVPLVNPGKKLQEENMFFKGQHGCHSAQNQNSSGFFHFLSSNTMNILPVLSLEITIK